MTTYHRYMLDDGASISLTELLASLRRIDDTYHLDGDWLFRGVHDCGIQIDISEPRAEVF